MPMIPGREVVVAGVGLHPFGRFPEQSMAGLTKTAILEALKDAGVDYQAIQSAYFGHVYYEGMSLGANILRDFGLTGIPIINVENACSSGSTGLFLAYMAVASGYYDIVLAFGGEKVPRGPVSVTANDNIERFLGTDFMMAGYAQMARRYMVENKAAVEAFARVAVKAHKNAAANPYAHYKKVFTIEEVLGSRMVADPLTLYQCCPTSEGASAAVICAKEVASKYLTNPKRTVTIAGASLRTSRYSPSDSERSQIVAASKEAYQMAGISPKEVNIVQVHDAATSGEVIGIEELGLVEKGQGWLMELDGQTEINGKLPVNTDGGLQGMGHPFGATGIRMIHEIVTQLRGEAGVRQVKTPSVGLAQCSGAGGVATVFILKK